MASLGTDGLQPFDNATEQLARLASALGSSLEGGGVAPFTVGEVEPCQFATESPGACVIGATSESSL